MLGQDAEATTRCTTPLDGTATTTTTTTTTTYTTTTTTTTAAHPLSPLRFTSSHAAAHPLLPLRASSPHAAAHPLSPLRCDSSALPCSGSSASPHSVLLPPCSGLSASPLRSGSSAFPAPLRLIRPPPRSGSPALHFPACSPKVASHPPPLLVAVHPLSPQSGSPALHFSPTGSYQLHYNCAARLKTRPKTVPEAACRRTGATAAKGATGRTATAPGANAAPGPQDARPDAVQRRSSRK